MKEAAVGCHERGKFAKTIRPRARSSLAHGRQEPDARAVNNWIVAPVKSYWPNNGHAQAGMYGKVKPSIPSNEIHLGRTTPP
jgi:hypothetical protein